MSKNSLQAILTLLGGLFLMVCGCHANKPDDIPNLYPCHITISQDGTPLANASVTLYLAQRLVTENSQVWLPLGTTDGNGVATIYTNARYAGAPAGQYKVLVNKIEATESADDTMPTEYRLIAAAYGKPEETSLEIEIKKGKNKFTFDVGPAVKELVKEQ